MTESQVCSTTALTFCMETFMDIAKNGAVQESRTHSLNILRSLFRYEWIQIFSIFVHFAIFLYFFFEKNLQFHTKGVLNWVTRWVNTFPTALSVLFVAIVLHLGQNEIHQLFYFRHWWFELLAYHDPKNRKQWAWKIKWQDAYFSFGNWNTSSQIILSKKKHFLIH